MSALLRVYLGNLECQRTVRGLVVSALYVLDVFWFPKVARRHPLGRRQYERKVVTFGPRSLRLSR